MKRHRLLFGGLLASFVNVFDKIHWFISRSILCGLRGVAKAPPVSNHINVVIVIRNCFFGDFVVCIPALRKIRQAFPKAQIVFMTATSFARGWKDRPQDGGVFQIEPGLIDEVVRYTSEDLRTADARSALRNRLIRSGSMLTIALCYSADSLLSRIKRVVLCRALALPFPMGLTGTRTLPAQHWLSRWRVGRDNIAHQHEAATACVDEVLMQLSMSAIDAPPITPRSRPITNRAFVVGVAPFTKQPVKQWPLERFAEVMRLLANDIKVCFEIYGAPEERDQAVQLYGMLDDSVPRILLCGELTPFQLREHIEDVDLLLCLDSGPAHIASLVGTPVVAIFSQITLHNFWRPWGPQGSLISVDVPCAACDTRTGQCPIGTKACIDGVQTDTVAQRVRAMLLARVASA